LFPLSDRRCGRNLQSLTSIIAGIGLITKQELSSNAVEAISIFSAAQEAFAMLKSNSSFLLEADNKINTGVP
jgi:hypothetical protein